MQVIKNENFKKQGLSEKKLVANKKFLNCNFEKCNLSGYDFINCHFEDCVFRDCNFSESSLALNEKYNSGSFRKCLFITCNLKETSFNFPIIDQCEFRNCSLIETNFDGSRFCDTKFIGELDSCFFRGYSVFAKKWSLLPPFTINPLKVPNNMVNVDFSRSKLIGIVFSDKVDLSKCIFPEGENYLYVADLKTTIERAVALIKGTWKEIDEKETAIRIIEMVYYNKDMQDQQNNFFDSFLIKENGEKAGQAGMKLFNLLKQLQNPQ